MQEFLGELEHRFDESNELLFSQEGREKRAIDNLESIVEILNQETKQGLKYAVVGGVALSVWMNNDYSPIRENNTIRDLDVMILEDPRDKVSEIENMIKENPDKFALPVEFSKIKPENYNSKFQLVSHFKKREEGHYLVFRDIEHRIPPELLERKNINLKINGKNLPIQTFEPGMILHLYLNRIANLKLKDKEKLINFLRTSKEVRKTYSDLNLHKKYKIIHDHVKEIRKRYPIYNNIIKLYNLIDYYLFNSIVSHKLIPGKILKKLLDI